MSYPKEQSGSKIWRPNRIYKESRFNNYSINDIKALFMAGRYTREVLKIYGHKVDEVLIDEAIYKVSAFSLIHEEASCCF
jgi:hypothetical protein